MYSIFQKDLVTAASLKLECTMIKDAQILNDSSRFELSFYGHHLNP